MTAKEFLTQGYRISDRIKSLTRQLNTLRSSTPTPNYGNTGGHGTEILSATERKGLKAIELEEKLSAEIARLEAVQLAIYNAIEGLSSIDEQLVLRHRYVQSGENGKFPAWERIACDLHMELRTVYRVHGKALEHLNF